VRRVSCRAASVRPGSGCLGLWGLPWVPDYGPRHPEQEDGKDLLTDRIGQEGTLHQRALTNCSPFRSSVGRQGEAGGRSIGMSTHVIHVAPSAYLMRFRPGGHGHRAGKNGLHGSIARRATQKTLTVSSLLSQRLTALPKTGEYIRSASIAASYRKGNSRIATGYLTSSLTEAPTRDDRVSESAPKALPTKYNRA
jgi:hypothetical protein